MASGAEAPVFHAPRSSPPAGGGPPPGLAARQRSQCEPRPGGVPRRTLEIALVCTGRERTVARLPLAAISRAAGEENFPSVTRGPPRGPVGNAAGPGRLAHSKQLSQDGKLGLQQKAAPTLARAASGRSSQFVRKAQTDLTLYSNLRAGLGRPAQLPGVSPGFPCVPGVSSRGFPRRTSRWRSCESRPRPFRESRVSGRARLADRTACRL
jgi:hypothetical protein